MKPNYKKLKPKIIRDPKSKLYKHLRGSDTLKTKVRIDMGNGVIHTVPELDKIKEQINAQK